LSGVPDCNIAAGSVTITGMFDEDGPPGVRGLAVRLDVMDVSEKFALIDPAKVASDRIDPARGGRTPCCKASPPAPTVLCPPNPFSDGIVENGLRWP